MSNWQRWSALCLVLALAGCDDDMKDADASADDDGGTLVDGGPVIEDAGTDAGPVEAPVVTAAAPTTVAHGAPLELSGTDLAGASVTIGGAEQTVGESSAESLTIDAVATETPTGEQDVIVTTAGGDSAPFTVTVIEALAVAGASAVDSVTATVMFSREPDPTTVGPEDFTIDGLAVTGAVASGSTVTLTTEPQAAGTSYTVTVGDVADEFGNGVTGANTGMFTGFTPDAPTITTISAGTLVRGFSELTIAGTNLIGATVTIGGAAQPIISATESEIVIGPVDGATPTGTQPVMVTTPGGSSGSMNVDVLLELQITGATASARTSVEVTFNRDVDATTIAAERFTIAGLTISAASASGPTVTLTTSEQAEGSAYTVAADAMVLDAYGSPASAGAFGFTGFVPPPPSEFIVVRVGDGATTLSAAAAPVFLERRLIADGSVVSTVPLPTAPSGSNLPFTLGGSGWTATSDGSLSRSEDGTMLALIGYQVVPGTADPRHVDDPRVVAVIDAADFSGTPSVNTSTTLGPDGSSGPFYTTSPRGAAIDGTTIWAVGGFGGVWTVPLGSNAATQIVTPMPPSPEPPSSGRAIAVFGGNLYYSSGGGSNPTQINQVGTGLPTAAGTSTTPVLTSSNPYSFTGFDRDPAEPGLDTFYVANGTTGLERWQKTGGTWSNTATFTSGVYQATCFEDGADVVCIASQAQALLYLRDVGGTSPSTALDSLISADADTQFRGVALPPLP